MKQETTNTPQSMEDKFGKLFIDEQDDQTEIHICSDKYPNESLFQLYSDPMDKETKDCAARIVECWNGYDKLKAENEKIKRLLHDLTPGGSEFYNDPEYCAKTIREMRESNHYTLSNIVKETKAENEALKEANKELVKELADLVERANRARNILQSDTSPSKGFWGVLDTQIAEKLISKHSK